MYIVEEKVEIVLLVVVGTSAVALSSLCTPCQLYARILVRETCIL